MNKFLKIATAGIMLSMASAASAQYTTEPSETLHVWVPPITLKADGTTITKMYVCETNNVNYSAFNMAFIVPEGIKVAMVKKGRVEVEDCELTARSADHSITCGQPNPTTIKVISYSPTLQDYYPDDEDGTPMDELFYIGLIAEPTMSPGEYQVEILDVKFVLESADAHILPSEPLYTTFTVENDNTTGIEEVNITETETTDKWYDLSGRSIDRPTSAGFYILNGRKVAVRM